MGEYIYSKGDLIKNPNTYFYADFKGIDFLHAWLQSREQVLSSIDVQEKLSHDDFFEITDAKNFRTLTHKYNETNLIYTKDLLLSILSELEKSSFDMSDNELAYWLDLLVKKFEVTKKIHESYGDSFKAVDKSKNRDFYLYILLSGVFCSAYIKTRHLKFLNVLLKVNDSLCSFSEELTEFQIAHTVKILKLEKNFVLQLSKELGVAI